MVQAQPAQVERKVLQVQLAVQVHKDKKVQLVAQDQLVVQEPKVLQVLLDQLVVQVLLDRKETKVKKVK